MQWLETSQRYNFSSYLRLLYLRQRLFKLIFRHFVLFPVIHSAHLLRPFLACRVKAGTRAIAS